MCSILTIQLLVVCLTLVRWPTTVTAKALTSRQKEDPHGKRKKTQSKRKSHGKKKTEDSRKNLFDAERTFQFLLLWPWGRGYSFCRDFIRFAVSLFLFAVRFFFLPWGISFLPWGYSFCPEAFLFAMMLIPFAVRFFSREPFSFCREVNSFAVTVVVHRTTFEILFPKILDFSTRG